MSWGEISCFKYGTCPHGPTPGTCNRKCLHYADKAPQDEYERLKAQKNAILAAQAPRHDEALLRIYLSAMPLGNYHTRDKHPSLLFRDGKPVLFVTKHSECNASPSIVEGAVAALVHLLNTREQTEIPRESVSDQAGR
jgi:hypothetical protein